MIAADYPTTDIGTGGIDTSVWQNYGWNSYRIREIISLLERWNAI